MAKDEETIAALAKKAIENSDDNPRSVTGRQVLGVLRALADGRRDWITDEEAKVLRTLDGFAGEVEVGKLIEVLSYQGKVGAHNAEIQKHPRIGQ